MRILLPFLLATSLAVPADDPVRALIRRGAAHEEAGRLADAARVTISLERLAARAGEVLYRAKESGRNRVVAAVA